MTDRDLTEYETAVGDALTVVNRAFPADIASDATRALRVACFTVVLADLLARTAT